MKETPLSKLHHDLGARMVEFAGYQMPLEYSGVMDEHKAVRNAAGIFDVSHMGEFWVKGKGALELLQYVTTNNVTALQMGQAQYSCLPNGRGGIVDDLIIYRYSDEKFMLVVNAANKEKDWNWLKSKNTFGAEMEDASDSMALIALQGPRAIDILKPLVSDDIESLSPFTFFATPIENAGEVIISATGYTGAGGFELYCYNKGAAILWERLMEIGSPMGLKPAGLAARDTLRLEMGYCLYGNDIDDSTSPIEAGLGWIVKLKSKDDFIDRKLLEEQKANGPDRKLTGVELTERGIPRHGYRVLSKEDQVIGKITSGTMSPSLGKGIGMAYISTGFAQPGTEVLIEVRNKKLKAKVVKFPFYKS